jgi:hypothetical protein
MILKLEKINKANDLTESWDNCIVDYFQSREFLSHTEKYNPCHQRYYVLKADEHFHAGLIVYSLKQDLLTFLPASAKIRMNISGIPCSVSASGFVGDIDLLPELASRIKSQEKGFHLFLNLDQNPDLPAFARGRTLPSIVLKNTFSSFAAYVKTLRSPYRRRYKRIAGKFTNIRIESGPCSLFSKEMYQQYLEVLKRSKGKLETLSMEFFKQLPAKFVLTHFYDAKKVIGWHITLADQNKFYYFLGGIDYSVNKKYNSYFNILFDILKQGIEAGASTIDFGQTAEIPKLRLGGEVVEKFMMAHHSNLILRKLLIAGSALLEYSSSFTQANVLKEIR